MKSTKFTEKQVQFVKEEISKEISSIRQSGFGYIETSLRLALFECVSEEDWSNKIVPDFYKNHPEFKISG
jgi:hypothetical protein